VTSYCNSFVIPCSSDVFPRERLRPAASLVLPGLSFQVRRFRLATTADLLVSATGGLYPAELRARGKKNAKDCSPKKFIADWNGLGSKKADAKNAASRTEFTVKA
jgi:hypothetical protein